MKRKLDQKKDEAKPNSGFDRGEDEVDKAMDENEDPPLGTIHMIGGQNHPDLKNNIRGKI